MFVIGLQNHFQRKSTQEPARYSKWGGFKDLDWDFLDREFYSKGGKKRTEGQDDDEEMVLEEKVKPSAFPTGITIGIMQTY